MSGREETKGIVFFIRKGMSCCGAFERVTARHEGACGAGVLGNTE